MTLVRRWWAFVARGAVALVACLALLALAAGLGFVGDGTLERIVAVWLGVHGLGALAAVQPDIGRWRALAVAGVVDLLAGVYLWGRAPLGPDAFAYALAAWGIASGLLQIAAAGRLRAALVGELNLAASGFASVLFGVIVGSFARAGTPDAVLPLAALAFVFAATNLKLAVRLHHAGGAAELPHG